MPEGLLVASLLVSPGRAILLQMTLHWAILRATFWPPPCSLTSTMTWWLSVKPRSGQRALSPRSYRALPRALAFLTTWRAYSSPYSFISRAVTARLGNLWMWVLLRVPGKIERSIFLQSFSDSPELPMMTPPWGPWKVLWVLEVMMSTPSLKGSWRTRL